MNIPESIAAFLFIAFCAFLGPLLDWEHDRWLKTLKSKRDPSETNCNFNEV